MNFYRFKVVLKKLITVCIHLTITFVSIEFFGVLIGFSICTLFYFGLYKIIPKQLNTGIYFFREKDYENARDSFNKSIKFFEKWQIFDKYGFVLLLNFSKYTYLESSLINKAAALVKLEKIQDALALYQRILAMYPENDIAKTQSEVLLGNLSENDDK
jgi:tetratricopeptide (TPR) repeat protein